MIAEIPSSLKIAGIIILALGIIVGAFFFYAPFNKTIVQAFNERVIMNGDKQNAEIGYVERTSNIIDRDASSDTFRTNGAFTKVLYSSAVNIQYEGKYIPVEDFFSVTDDHGNVVITDLYGRNCVIKQQYDLVDKTSGTKSALEKITIEKNRGGWYFTTDAGKEVNSMEYALNCSGFELSYSNDKLYMGDLTMDFAQAKDVQGIATTYDDKTNSLSFTAIDGNRSKLSLIDPSVTLTYTNQINDFYIYNSTHNYFYGFMQWNVNSLNSVLSIDSAILNLKIAEQDGINNTISVYLINDSSQNFSVYNVSYIFNKQKSNQTNITIPTGSNIWVNMNIDNIVKQNFNNSYLILRFDSTLNNTIIPQLKGFSNTFLAGTFDTGKNYVKFYSSTYITTSSRPNLTISYSDLFINNPTSNQLIVNNLSTIINTSQSGYNNTVWYSIDAGVTNTTLCTNSNDCATLLTFPSQGYYNLTTWANKSDGTLITKSATNLFVGNETNISVLGDTYVYQANPGNNYGTSTYFYTRGYLNSDMNAWLTFNLANLSDSILIKDSQLRLYVTSASMSSSNYQNVSVYESTNKTWNETRITWATRPYSENVSESRIKFNSSSVAGWYNWTISNMTNISLVTDKILSLSLKQNGTVATTEITYASKEYATASLRPYINVLYLEGTDSTKPRVTISSPLNQTYTTTNINFNFILSENGYCEYTLNNGATNYTMTNSSLTSWNANNATVKQGSSTVFAYCNDTTGNTNYTTSTTFFIDTIPPASVTDLINTTIGYTNVTINWTNPVDADFNYSMIRRNSVNIANTSSSGYFDSGLSTSTNYTYTLWTVDLYGNINNTDVNLTITTGVADLTSPQVNISNPLNQTYTTNNINFNFTLNEVGYCEYTINNGATNYTMVNSSTTIWGAINSSMKQGSTTVRAYCNDTSNNKNYTEYKTFFIDSISPIVNILSPLNQTYKVPLSINISLNEAGYCKYTFNNGATNYTMTANSSSTGFGSINSSIADGSYVLKAYCNDTLGNTNYTANITFSMDSSSPSVTIDNPLNQTYTTNNINFNFTLTESGYCEYTLNNGLKNYTMTNSSTTSWNANNDSMTQGTHTVKAYCNDTMGNKNYTEAKTFYIDTGIPRVTIVNPLNQTYTTTNINFNFSLNEAGYCKYTLNGGVTNYTMTANSSSTGFNANNNSMQQGSVTARAYCNDTSNNKNYTEYKTFFIDSIVPASVTDLTNTTLDATNVTINWTNPVDVDFNYTIIKRNGINIVNTSLEGYFSNGLTPETSYTFTLWTVDFSGNINNTDVNLTIITPAGIDSTPPTITFVGSTNTTITTTNSYTVNVTITPAGERMDSCILTWNGTNETMGNYSKNYFVTKTGLSDARYNFTVTCNNTDGYTSWDSRYIIIDYIDETSPVITFNGQTNTTITATNNYMVNTTITPAGEKMDSCILTWNGVNETMSNYTKNYYSTKTSLADGRYNFTVTCNNTDGYASWDSRYIIIDYVDTFPSVVVDSPADLATDTDGNVDFIFNATDDKGISSCQLWGNWSGWGIKSTNNSVINGALTTMSLTSIPAGTFRWNIKCNDTAGQSNWSISNRTITITDALPTITLSSPADLATDTDGNVDFIFNATDDKSITNCKLFGNWSGSWSSKFTKTPITNGALSTISQTNLPAGTFVWGIRCIDSISQINWSENRTITILDSPPTLTLNYPADGALDTDGNVEFQFTPSDDRNVSNCSVYGNWGSGWGIKSTSSSITNGAINTILIYSITSGNYTWNVNCLDTTAQSIWASNRTLRVLVNTTETYWKFQNKETGEDMFTISKTTGDFHSKGSGLIEDNLVVGGSISADSVTGNRMLVTGEDENSLIVGKYYVRIDEPVASARIIMSGRYTATEDKTYIVYINTSNGNTIGLATFSWSDDGTTNWVETDRITQSYFVDLSNGVQIAWENGTFNDGDIYGFNALYATTSVIHVDTLNDPIGLVSLAGKWTHNGTMTFNDEVTVNANVTNNGGWFKGLFDWIFQSDDGSIVGSFNGSTLVLSLNGTMINNTINSLVSNTILLNYYNKSQIDNNLSLYLLITDQRYNDTQFINDVNSTLSGRIDALPIANLTFNQSLTNTLYYSISNPSNYINISSGQFFNDTGYIDGLLTKYYNITQIENNFSNYYTKSQVDNNLSYYLLLTDQRFNETQLINDVNTSLYNYINNQLANYYNKSDVYNKSEMDTQSANWNSTYNETYANYVIANMSNSTTWWSGISGFVSQWFFKSGNNLEFNATMLNNTIDQRFRNPFDQSLNTTDAVKFNNVTINDTIFLGDQSRLEIKSNGDVNAW